MRLSLAAVFSRVIQVNFFSLQKSAEVSVLRIPIHRMYKYLIRNGVSLRQQPA